MSLTMSLTFTAGATCALVVSGGLPATWPAVVGATGVGITMTRAVFTVPPLEALLIMGVSPMVLPFVAEAPFMFPMSCMVPEGVVGVLLSVLFMMMRSWAARPL